MKIALIVFILTGALAGLICYLDHLLLRPLRWMRRARMFVNVIDAAHKSGRPVEQTLIEMAARGGQWPGIHLHVVAAWLRRGLRLHEALERVPRMLPRAIQVLIVRGSETGRLIELLPLARREMRELSSGVGQSPLIMGLTLGTALLGVTGLLFTFVLPKFHAIAMDFEIETGPWLNFILEHRGSWTAFHIGVMALMLFAYEYLTGGGVMFAWKQRMRPRTSGLIHGMFPWHRRLFRRRFAMILARLLDMRFPEADAVEVAGEACGNRATRARVAAVKEQLASGVKLADALCCLGFGADFEFRVRTAAASGVPLSGALEEWFETELFLARWRESAAVQLIGFCFTLYNAAIIGAVGIAIFAVEIRMMDAAMIY